ncbi:hypothetical protein [Streptococcus suis]|uniref:hypothetical protein n=1 Tax=Streptococcus suis TaxID=1307 RepID=UPI00041590CA|nr:hypothetical protein [Streptococcus suis]
MLEVKKKLVLVRDWINHLRDSNLNIKYITDKEEHLEIEISRDNLVWSVLVNNPDFAPYKNIFIEVIDLDDIDNYYIMSWGDQAASTEADIISKLNETIEIVLR